MWRRVNLRKKDKNLPAIGRRVIWATTESGTGKSTHQFMGWLSKDQKYIDYGYGTYKLTSNFWWHELPDNPITD